jgi:NAD-dependent dihydropyrimidine dehydrogenase PreA subunit
MLDTPFTVVVSQGQSRNPEKRAIEEGIAQAATAMQQSLALTVPHLYDVQPEGETIQSLRAIAGPMVVFSWLYERAAHWVLDRNGIRGQVGAVELKPAEDDEDEDEDKDDEESEKEKAERVVDWHPRPNRHIYCVDLRSSEKLEDFIQELKRIYDIERQRQDSVVGGVSDAALARFANPTNDTALAADGSGQLAAGHQLFQLNAVNAIDEHPGRRWYPVIDFSRCTNCMECIDFCLFGVYGVDGAETILVEQPDNCRKGCPACSRVCPQNAIIFPQHKTPAIAGAPVDAGGFKIDLSKLFGAPERNEDPETAAARERDEQLILAGRQAVGMTPPAPAKTEKDDLDKLVDQLDAMDL